MIKPEKHSLGLRCARRAKVDLEEAAGVLVDKKNPGRTWHRDQVLLETETDLYLSPVRLVAGSLQTAGGIRGWNLMEQYLNGDIAPRGSTATPREDFNRPTVMYSDIDRALNVMQDMGRWDVAFRMVLDLYDMPGMGPFDVVWETFPHKSKMLLMTGPNTGVHLGGACKDVVEHWWALNGGYHAKRIHVVDDKEFDNVMNGIRNPYRLAGVNRDAARERVARDLHSVKVSRDPIAAWSGDYRVVDGVLYVPDAGGTYSPWWATTLIGEPCAAAWDKKFRRELAGELGIPLLVRRAMD